MVLYYKKEKKNNLENITAGGGSSDEISEDNIVYFKLNNSDENTLLMLAYTISSAGLIIPNWIGLYNHSMAIVSTLENILNQDNNTVLGFCAIENMNYSYTIYTNVNGKSVPYNVSCKNSFMENIKTNIESYNNVQDDSSKVPIEQLDTIMTLITKITKEEYFNLVK